MKIERSRFNVADVTPMSRAKAEANTRLMAAAPDLFAACVIAEEVLDGSIRSPARERALDCLRAAIAKAEGVYRSTGSTTGSTKPDPAKAGS